VDGTILLARPDRLPMIWRAGVRGPSAEPSGPTPGEAVALGARWLADDGARWEAAQVKRLDINWVDTPVSGVARDISNGFGIDLIVSPTIAAEQKLLQFERAQADLETVCMALGEQLGASLAYVDGALWAPPRAAGGDGGRVVGLPRRQPLPASRPASVGAGLAGVVAVDRSVTTWPAFGERLAKASGFRCRVVVAPEADGPDVEATGPVADILEGAQMLGRLSWSLATEADGQPTLRVSVPSTGSQLW